MRLISIICRRARRHELRLRFWGATSVGLRPSCVAPQSGEPTTRKNRQRSTYLKREAVQTNRASSAGDAINAVLAAAGYNFRRLLAWLRLLLSIIWAALAAANNAHPEAQES